jgi:hypothetical protein
MSYNARGGGGYGNNRRKNANFKRGKIKSKRADGSLLKKDNSKLIQNVGNEAVKETTWKADLLRKDPCITKIEKIKPCPTEMTEENKLSLTIDPAKLQITPSRDAIHKIVFPKSEHTQQPRPKKRKKKPYA